MADFYLRRSENNPIYVYKDYVMCPQCGERFRGSSSRGKLGKYYAAYHCSRGHTYFRVPIKDMEDAIEKFIPQVAFTDDFKAKFRKLTLEELEKRIDEAMHKELILCNKKTIFRSGQLIGTLLAKKVSVQ